jgi:uncharacterized protein (TIGR03437 family)
VSRFSNRWEFQVSKYPIFSVLFLVSATVATGQTGSTTCQVAAVSPVLRAEGVSERIGDLVLNCTGPANQAVTGVLTVILNSPVTNRIAGSNLEVVVTINHGSGASILPVTARLQLANQVVFDNFTMNLGPNGRAEVRISNLRADVSQPSVGLREVSAQLAFNPPGLLNLTSSNVPAGVVNRGLFATSLLRLVGSQLGSRLPDSFTFSAFIEAKTAFSSSRLTEGFVSAFEKRGPGMDHGVRILLRFSGLTSDSRLFVPAAVAGSNAQRPTAAGDFGGSVHGGQYTPGSNSLLLVRVSGADQNGAGGIAAFAPTSATTLNEMTEVSNNNGTAVAVYEVYDSNPAVIESVQIPAFLGVARSELARSVTVNREIFFAPLSTAPSASPFASIPRFAAIAPPSDCEITSDCELYRPKLVINSALLDFEATQGLPYVRREVIFSNEGGGVMPWTARVEYRTGSGWVQLAPESGLQGAAVGVQLVLTNLQPGTYEATLVIDAGPEAGVQRLPIRLKLNPRPAPPPPTPAITSVGNAATFQGALVPGSLATVRGANLAGANLSVAFNARPVRLLFSSSEQINFEVPADLTGPTAQLVITANGVASSPAAVTVAPVNPGIFVPGILNQDNTVNSPTNPARAGTFVQIYATGLLAANGSGQVDAKLHDLTLTSLPYAGPAPGIPGVQQANLMIPEGWPTMTTDVLLCGTVAGQRACSPPVRISVAATP